MAEQAKRALSDHDETQLRLAVSEKKVQVTRVLTRKELEAAVDDIVARTLAPCRQALKDAGLEPREIDEVVMVGGSTRMPLVRQRVGEFFGRGVMSSAPISDG